MAHTGDDITHPIVMVEAANLLQIVFFRGKACHSDFLWN